MDSLQRGPLSQKPGERRSSSLGHASLQSASPLQRKRAEKFNEKHSLEFEAEEYSTDGVYSTFMRNLAKADSEKLSPQMKQELKTCLLVDFHNHLETLSTSEIRNFGERLENEIKEHEKTDTLDRALTENRVIYRSWHEPKRISDSITLGASVEGGKELVGADSLTVALDPVRFRNYKDKIKEPESELVPIGAVPSSVLYAGQINTVFNKDRGTATALLPENLYAAFNAYNEAVKSLHRGKSPEGMEELGDHAKLMRASVTRPIFYNKSDIQSSTGAYHHDRKPNGPHARKTHFDLDNDYNPLNRSLDEKLDNDPLRSNAIFYQTFTQHSKSNPKAEEWNEMVVKYRSTGHMAGLHDNIRKWVPVLKSHDAINNNLTPKVGDGGFDPVFAKTTAVWADNTLRGEEFDPKEEVEQKEVKQKKRGGNRKGGIRK